jgi:hypothetical protein
LGYLLKEVEELAKIIAASVLTMKIKFEVWGFCGFAL